MFADPRGDPTPLLGAVGPMQFEVATHRLEYEFGAKVVLDHTGYVEVRATDPETASELQGEPGVRIVLRSDLTMLALFECRYRLDRLVTDHPGWTLTPLLGGG